MFEPITGLPDGVIGFEAVGTDRGHGLRRRPDAGHRPGAEGGGVRLVLVLGDRFTGYSPGAMKEDAGLVAHATCVEANGRRQRSRVGRPPVDGVRVDGARQVQAVRTRRAGRRHRLGRRARMSVTVTGQERQARTAAASRPAIRVQGLVKRLRLDRGGPRDRPRGPHRGGLRVSSGPTGPARARPSGACSTSSGRRAGRSRSSGRIHGTPASTSGAESATSRASCDFPSG